MVYQDSDVLGYDPADLYQLQSSFPATKPPVTALTGNANLKYLPLSKAETNTFDEAFRRLAAIQSLERDLSPILLSEELLYFYAAGIAKGAVGTNPKFSGNEPGNNEIGMQLIRAITVLNPGITSGSPVLTWPQVYGAAGWQNVFGSAANPVDLSQTGLGTSATNLQNRVMLCFSGLVNTAVPPLLGEYRLHILNTDYSIHALTWEPVSDLAYARFATPVIVPVNTRFYMRGNMLASGTDATQLLGVTFATGSYLQYET